MSLFFILWLGMGAALVMTLVGLSLHWLYLKLKWRRKPSA